MKRIILLLALTLAATVVTAAADDDPGLASISSADLMTTVNRLASRDFQGRLPGTPGYDAAAEWAAGRFADLGLEPAGDDGFLQRFTIESNMIGAPCHLDVIHDGEIVRSCSPGADFVCRGFTGSGSFTAPVVFVGYGVSDPERGYDDYAGVDVEGKIIMAFKPAPSWKVNDEGWGHAHYPRVRSRVAAEHGAVGMILVSVPGERVRPPIGSVLHGEGEQDLDFPQIHVDLPVAADLLAGSGKTLAELHAMIVADQAPHSLQLTTEATLDIHADYQLEAPTANVVALLRGADPNLAEEYLVLGAHLDHVGAQGDELWFPGANDNASGCAAILELAEAFTLAEEKPLRSIVFILFSGEEQGLNGARHYADNPAYPHEQTKAMFNFDCIACGDSLRVGGGKTAPDLWATARRLDAEDAKLMTANTWGGGGADATPFFEAGVKTLYWVTTNTYAHLHAPTDLPDTLNEPLFEQLVRLAYRVARDVVNP